MFHVVFASALASAFVPVPAPVELTAVALYHFQLFPVWRDIPSSAEVGAEIVFGEEFATVPAVSTSVVYFASTC